MKKNTLKNPDTRWHELPVLSPEVMAALKASTKSLFRPDPESYARWQAWMNSDEYKKQRDEILLLHEPCSETVQ